MRERLSLWPTLTSVAQFICTKGDIFKCLFLPLTSSKHGRSMVLKVFWFVITLGSYQWVIQKAALSLVSFETSLYFVGHADGISFALIFPNIYQPLQAFLAAWNLTEWIIWFLWTDQHKWIAETLQGNSGLQERFYSSFMIYFGN